MRALASEAKQLYEKKGDKGFAPYLEGTTLADRVAAWRKEEFSWMDDMVMLDD